MNYDLLAIGTTIATALMAIATVLPKLIANFKKDKLDGTVASVQRTQVDGIQHSYEQQLTNLIGRFAKMELKVDAMENTIHMQSIKVTRLIVVVIHMRGLLASHSVPIPEHIKAEIDLLTALDEPTVPPSK